MTAETEEAARRVVGAALQALETIAEFNENANKTVKHVWSLKMTLCQCDTVSYVYIWNLS